MIGGKVTIKYGPDGKNIIEVVISLTSVASENSEDKDKEDLKRFSENVFAKDEIKISSGNKKIKVTSGNLTMSHISVVQ